MQAALRLTGMVQPGGKVEVSSLELPLGKAVEVIVLFPQETEVMRRSVIDVLAEAPGHILFQTAEEVDAHLREEKDAWKSELPRSIIL